MIRPLNTTKDGILMTVNNDVANAAAKETATRSNAGPKSKANAKGTKNAISGTALILSGDIVVSKTTSARQTKRHFDTEVVCTLPHMLSQDRVDRAVERTRGDGTSQPLGKTITVNTKKMTQEKKRSKRSGKNAHSSRRGSSEDKRRSDSYSDDDDVDDDEDNASNKISLANDSQATEITSNLHTDRNMHRTIGGSYAIGNADEATIATDLAEADGTDHSVYEYVVHAYKTAKQNQKISFVDLYWAETAKRNRAEEERARARQVQEAEDLETGDSSSNGKEISNDATINAKKEPKSKLLCFLQLYVFVLFAATVVTGTMCGGLGMCVMDNDEADKDVSEQSVKPFMQKPFYSRLELIRAIDQFLIDPSSVPAVYGTEGIGRWDVSQISDFSHVFSAQRNENMIHMNEDLNGWNTSQAEKMDSMFLGAQSFQGKGVSGWDVSKVKSMVGMFESCTSFDQDLATWDTRRVEDFSFIFARSSFTGKGISEWLTSSAVNMSYAFFELQQMDSDFSTWDTSHVVDFSFMVRQCCVTIWVHLVVLRLTYHCDVYLISSMNVPTFQARDSKTSIHRMQKI